MKWQVKQTEKIGNMIYIESETRIFHGIKCSEVQMLVLRVTVAAFVYTTLQTFFSFNLILEQWIVFVEANQSSDSYSPTTSG